MTPVSLDFETYSEAGYVLDPVARKWESAGGLKAVGAAVYAEHPSTEVLVACYQFLGGPVCTWVPGMPHPDDLLEHVRRGGTVCAQYSMFEWLIWDRVCRRRYGWPPLPLEQTRDTAAVVRAYGLPGTLEHAAKAMGLTQQKDAGGAALIRRFSVPRDATKKNAKLRNYLGDDHANAYRLYDYCAQDVRTEAALNAACPPLSAYELDVWQLDQRINERGVAVDVEALRNCQAIVAGISERLTAELRYLTHGRIESAAQVAEIGTMLAEYGVNVPNLQADTVSWVLGASDHAIHQHPWARRVLEIRAALASASVKKLEAIHRMMCSDGRVRGLFMYYGAERTGRWAGRGAQPQNFPRGDGHAAALEVLESFKDRDVQAAIDRWGDVLGAMAGALRALFVAAPGRRLVCSDYSAIEAVVLAALAGEEWRLEVFRTHGKIYEVSASKITGVPLEEILAYREQHGEHHPHRQPYGKVAELASGYGGGLNAWKAFGAGEHMDDETIRENVKRWRRESPRIVDFWYGLERAAVAAIMHPGHACTYRGIRYESDTRVLRCWLPSGRPLVYHRPRVEDDFTPWGAPTKRTRFWGWNSNPNYGTVGWRELETYGGRLAENVTQAVARDLMAHGMLQADAAGYNIVLHVHDEIVCEQPAGHGSVAELERLMGTLPAWAAGWPVVARGGWEGREYRKE